MRVGTGKSVGGKKYPSVVGPKPASGLARHQANPAVVGVSRVPEPMELPFMFGLATEEECELHKWGSSDMDTLVSELADMRRSLQALISAASAPVIDAAAAVVSQLPPPPLQPPSSLGSKSATSELDGVGVGGAVVSPPSLKRVPGKSARRLVAHDDFGDDSDSGDEPEPPAIETDVASDTSRMAPPQVAPTGSGAGAKTRKIGPLSLPRKSQGKSASKSVPIGASKSVPPTTAAAQSRAKRGAAGNAVRRKKRGTATTPAPDSEDDIGEELQQTTAAMVTGKSKSGGTSAAAPTSGYQQNFWASMESYLRPFNDADMRLLDHVQEGNSSDYTMPQLGKHYLRAWAEEDAEATERTLQASGISSPFSPLGGIGELQQPLVRTVSSKHATRLSTAIAEGNEDVCPIGDLTQRAMAALIDLPGMHTPVPVTARLASTGADSEDTAAHYAAVEEAVRFELMNLSLIDEQLPDPTRHEDDEICMEMRAAVAKYREQVVRMNEIRERLRERVLALTAEQQQREAARVQAMHAVDQFRKLAKRTSTTKKPRAASTALPSNV